MAYQFPESVPMLESEIFDLLEISIRKAFNFLVQKLIERRDQLLLQLRKLINDYRSDEEMRIKNIKKVDTILRQNEEMELEQNSISDMHYEHLQKLKEKQEKYQQPTLIPSIHFTFHLKELKQKIEMFGTLQNLPLLDLYRKKSSPIKSRCRAGKGGVELSYPSGVVVDEKGNMFIADTCNSRIQLVSSVGQYIGEFGKGELNQPRYVALDKRWLFITDFKLNKVLKYEVQTYQFKCESVLELRSPLGMSIDDNEVFVADCENNRIVVLSLDLEFIRELGNHKLVKPRDVTVHLNTVFIADNGTPNIHIYSKNGDLLKSIIGLSDGASNIFLCFDKFNNIIISDWSSKVIQICTLEGQLVHRIKCNYYPAGVAVTKDNIIISVDYFNHKINLY